MAWKIGWSNFRHLIKPSCWSMTPFVIHCREFPWKALPILVSFCIRKLGGGGGGGGGGPLANTFSLRLWHGQAIIYIVICAHGLTDTPLRVGHGTVITYWGFVWIWLPIFNVNQLFVLVMCAIEMASWSYKESGNSHWYSYLFLAWLLFKRQDVKLSVRSATLQNVIIQRKLYNARCDTFHYE